jgi:hypothetical protein
MMMFGLTTIPTLICTVSTMSYNHLTSILTFDQGEIKRTKGFYTEDFKYLKSLLKPEASNVTLLIIAGSYSLSFRKCLLPR